MLSLLALPLIYLLVKPKSKMENPNAYNIEKTLREILAIFGEKITRDIEQIYRLETRNFSSGQFMKSLSPGMEATSQKFPYGWGSLRKFWEEQPTHRPTGIVKMNDSDTTDGIDSFIKFPSLFSAMFALGLVLKKRGNASSWYSTDPEKQKYYDKLLASQKTTITNKILA